ncbi:RDD family protein [Vampirovibrio chlorellavorus]|uniref:RDD family protein n=1 Tax=Vampirovibrio chlorellavorus TaxID=758823 RepID=UPI0026F10390|nr:RDD family protein [Vampirovibrio chlorellavorus]
MNSTINNLEYAGTQRRLIAFLLDKLILLPFVFGAYALFWQWIGLWTVLIHVGIEWFYTSDLEAGPWQGTFGKRILGLRVCGSQGQYLPIEWVQLRFLCNLVVNLGLVFLIGIFASLMADSGSNPYPFVGGLLLIVGAQILFMTLNDKKQGMHDLLPGAVVVFKIK